MNVLFVTSVLLAITVIANGANDPDARKPTPKPLPGKAEPKKQKAVTAAKMKREDAPTAAKATSTAAKSSSAAANTDEKVPGTSINAVKTTSAKADGTGKGKPANAQMDGTVVNEKPFSDQAVNDSPAADDIASKNKVVKPTPKTKEEKINKGEKKKDKIESKQKTEAKAMPEPKETSTKATGNAAQNETNRTLMTAMLGIFTVLVKFNV